MAYLKSIRLCGETKILCCDGLCQKAFGQERPKRVLGDGRVMPRPDAECGIVAGLEPRDPLSEWCLTECERAFIADLDGSVFESPVF